MNNIIALDTSTEACSVALQCNGEAIFRYRVEPRMHAKLLLPMLNELLDEAGISTQQIDAVAFGRGPGAFTGVRIGTAAAQAIALGGDLPVAPVSTLASIAHRSYREHGKQKVAVAIDARMGEVYWGAYEITASASVTQLGDERVCLPAEADRLDSDWCASGTGWGTYESVLTQVTGATIAEDVDPFPHALDILLIGSEQLVRGEGVTPENALPVYLRDNVALTEKERAEKERAEKERAESARAAKRAG